MATGGALEHPELMSEGKNLRLQRCASLKGLPSRRKQRENDRHHVAEKLQRRLPKFNQFNQNGVFGRDNRSKRTMLSPAELDQMFGSLLPGIRCPQCKWAPRTKNLWSCKCGHQWNTFDTR